MHFAIRFFILDQDSTSTQYVALFPLKTFKIPEINLLGLEPLGGGCRVVGSG